MESGWEATTESGAVTIPPEPTEPISGDINRDGVVNTQDLVIINGRFGQRGQNSADVNGDGIVNIYGPRPRCRCVLAGKQPHLRRTHKHWKLLTAADVQGWLSQAQQLALTDPAYLRGVTMLEQLLTALIPQETALLPNYPNPFNPETWIPYHLAKDAEVTLTIYDAAGGDCPKHRCRL